MLRAIKKEKKNSSATRTRVAFSFFFCLILFVLPCFSVSLKGVAEEKQAEWKKIASFTTYFSLKDGGRCAFNGKKRGKIGIKKQIVRSSGDLFFYYKSVSSFRYCLGVFPITLLKRRRKYTALSKSYSSAIHSMLLCFSSSNVCAAWRIQSRFL